jgi:hypothetical protein
MRSRTRLLFGGLALAIIGAIVVVRASTTNHLAKYNSSGALIDSSMVESGGLIGIGTETPWLADLEIVRNGDAEAAVAVRNKVAATQWFVPGFRVENYYGAAGGSAGFRSFVGRGSTSAPTPLQQSDWMWEASAYGQYDTTYGHQGLGSRIVMIAGGNYSSTSTPAMLTFWTTPVGSTTNSERMRITSAGKVGIGTTTPSATLSVAGDASVSGNMTVTGNIAAKYQDVAEWVPSRYRLSPGTVVVIDSGADNAVDRSQVEYDTRVAGVVSEQPGITLGIQSTGKALVAHTGRVKVRVDADYGAVRPGDLLVTSPTKGFAMKSEAVDVGGAIIHRPGTVLGKALQSLKSGKGEILVLLTLQ